MLSWTSVCKQHILRYNLSWKRDPSSVTLSQDVCNPDCKAPSFKGVIVIRLELITYQQLDLIDEGYMQHHADIPCRRRMPSVMLHDAESSAPANVGHNGCLYDHPDNATRQRITTYQLLLCSVLGNWVYLKSGMFPMRSRGGYAEKRCRSEFLGVYILPYIVALMQQKDTVTQFTQVQRKEMSITGRLEEK